MQKTEHTPAPWKLNISSPSFAAGQMITGRAVVISEINEKICEMYDIRGKEGQFDAIEKAANARLISQAPNLLHLAIEIKEAYSDLSAIRKLSLFEEAVWLKATELINKAT